MVLSLHGQHLQPPMPFFQNVAVNYIKILISVIRYFSDKIISLKVLILVMGRL